MFRHAAHLAHLGKLTWVEVKIFLREPMGAIGTVLIPVILFIVLGRLFRGETRAPRFVSVDLPIFVVIFIVIGAVLSLTTIIAIYREGGILKRLKATPLSPLVILSTHVVVKLVLTSVTLALMVVAGRRFYSGPPPPAPTSFFLGVILVSVSLLSLGFILASVVRTARFAQPIGSILLYALLSISGLFFPIRILPEAWQAVALASPITHGVSLLRGLWAGDGWAAHWVAILALIANLVICSAISKRVFRWE
ncbi:MAG: ABC transporter permease [bacterium]|nr:ABC transporter permease [bacterium]